MEYHVRNIKATKFAGIVGVDESLFGGKVKQHRGRPLGKRIRIVDVLECNTNRIKLFPVDKREGTTLLDIIVQNVEAASREVYPFRVVCIKR